MSADPDGDIPRVRAYGQRWVAPDRWLL